MRPSDCSVRGGPRALALGLALACTLTLAACGSKRAQTAASTARARGAGVPRPGASCEQTVADTLARVVRHIYLDGVSSERTVVARRLVAASQPVRQALETGDATAARAAASSLVANGRMTAVRLLRGGRVLGEAGSPSIAPIRGRVTGAHGRQIGSYVASVWSHAGFIAEASGLGQGRIDLRSHDRSVGGSLRLPPGRLSERGTLHHGGVAYQFASFGGHLYPSGQLRVYLLKPRTAAHALCGSNGEDTVVNTLAVVARLIYEGEAGPRTRPQVRRVQSDAALLRAVAAHDAEAARLAIDRLLSQHIVRLRVFAGSALLKDVGGPYVLAPVSAPLSLHGRRIGSFTLSIQDDEGYLRLARRLAGLRVLMYMGQTLVKNSLGPDPGSVPDSGSYEHRGERFRVYTLHAQAFPSGPLKINVLIPMPYR